MADAIHHLINGELELFKQAINATLYSKVGQAFEEKKQEIAQEMFSEECMDCPKGKLKKFAALAPPYDIPTEADRIAGALLNRALLNKKNGKK